MSSGQSVPAGWYVDQAGTERWWDGSQWGMSAADWRVKYGATSVAAPTGADPGSSGPTGAHGDDKQLARQADRERKQAKHAHKDAEHVHKHAERQLRRSEREHQKEQAAHEKDVAKRHPEWQRHMEIAEDVLHTMETAAPTTGGTVMLHSDELFYKDFACELIANRTQREFVAGSQGVSIPVGSIGGHAIRYRVGAIQGHSTSETVATVVDTGRVAVTTQRVIFYGPAQTREHLFSKLIAYAPIDQRNFQLSVSNRQAATHLRFTPQDAGDFFLFIEIATAAFRGERDKLIADTRQQVEELRAAEPK